MKYDTAAAPSDGHHDGLNRVRTTAEIRDAVAWELDAQLEDDEGWRRWDVGLGLEARALRATVIRRYSAALESIDRVLAAEKAAAGTAAPVDVDGLIVKVWDEIQEAGYPTLASDVAVAAVARVFGSDVPMPPVDNREESTND